MDTEVGKQIRVKKSHWARSGQVGEVVEMLENGRLVIKFKRAGIGYDDGWCLVLGEDDLEATPAA